MKKNIRLILIGLLVFAGLYGVLNYQADLIPYLPFAFLLGCLVMHLFMHGGHGDHEGHERTSDQTADKKDANLSDQSHK